MCMKMIWQKTLNVTIIQGIVKLKNNASQGALFFLCVENKFNKFVCFDKRERTVPS